MKIKVLPDTVVNRIAAGEVVERPASVVRELVENSIDAGATDVLVSLVQGGHSLITVTDNGSGMARDDALLAFERHATSKIADADDLQSITTLGFRGEALPSIASVSKVRLRTRPSDREIGTELQIQGGAVKAVADTPGAVGTEIEVKHLFFNTPARRKFLKQPKTEELRVKGWLTATALAHPQVRVRLFCDQREVLNLPARATMKERALSVIRGSSVPFDTVQGAGAQRIHLSGLVAHPSLAQADAAALIVLVNGRVISDRGILKAVREGFLSTLKEREFPVGVIAIELDASKVDVNVHPQKSEVRFSDPRQVFEAVRVAVADAVNQFRAPVFGLQPPRSSPAPGGAAQGTPYRPGSPALTPNLNAPVAPSLQPESGQDYSAAPVALRIAEGGSSLAPQEEPFGEPLAERQAVLLETAVVASRFFFSDLQYIGQLLECYLVCEREGRLYVVDMHAAHERYNYNLIRNAIKAAAPRSQQLLVPLTVQVGERGVEALSREEELVSRAGFFLEPFGADAVLVRAAPHVRGSANIEAMIKQLAVSLAEEWGGGALEELHDHIAARLACHASVRSGRALQREEVYALFKSLDSSEFSAACPHGRPVVVSFSEGEIERWFGRDR